MKRLLAASALTLALAACNEQAGSTKSLSPIPAKTVALMSEKGMSKSDHMLVRVYKKESELEIWKKVDGHYAHLKTFPICRWSGQLGPKVKEGDRQAPEGFYAITPAQMNPNSSFHLSFDTGYPNAYDRSHDRTGSHLMVHGDCSSRGCYAMTDEGISEVYALARESFGAGQRSFQLQAYPFRMTADNLARYRQDPNMAFWKNLKQGSDHFEVTRREPKVSVCQGRYSFNTVGDGCKDDPTLAPAVAQKDDDDRRQVAELVAKGTPATRLVYSDGGQHSSFSTTRLGIAGDAGSNFAILDTRPSRPVGQVSRPEALAEGPREVPMESGAKPAKAGTSVAFAAAKPGTPSASASETASTRRSAGRTVLASADPDLAGPLAAGPPAEPEGKALYERMFTNVFGGSEPAKPVATTAPPAPEPAARKTSRATDGLPPAKPKAKAESTADRPSRTLAGAADTGPSPSGFRSR